MTMGVRDEGEDFGSRRVHGHAAGDLAFTGFDGAHRCLWHCIPFVPGAGKRKNGVGSLSTLVPCVASGLRSQAATLAFEPPCSLPPGNQSQWPGPRQCRGRTERHSQWLRPGLIPAVACPCKWTRTKTRPGRRGGRPPVW
jgi:hypothetical protein